ncbi:MAG: DUF4417 domain-containing protein [Chloroflexi bacterium]|nr:DUF4417 domain-containing protein [Chloroflexota bacterium]MCI0731089.1 DUF4417 domain-containing protein [Chloroflexota bacterium]
MMTSIPGAPQRLTRTSHRWHEHPGRFDSLNTAHLFPADNDLDIPTLAHTPLAKVPRWLVPYRTRIRSVHGLAGGAVHWFLDDYRFESVWYRPYKALEALKGYRMVLTPDFSLYRDWPLALQIWNTYRNRWCGAFWQAHGLTVIPTISWSTAASYEFCFLGVARRSVVAISTVGLAGNKPLEQQLFLDGFSEMVRRLAPSRVLCYGRAPAECHQTTTIITYPTRWEGIVKAREKGAAIHGR